MPFSTYFAKSPKRLAIFVGVILLLLLGFLDHQISADISVDIFYLFPVSLITWFVERWMGFLSATGSVAIWYFANEQQLNQQSWLVVIWNAASKLSFFLAFSYLLSALHQSLESGKQLARTDLITGLINKKIFFELANLEVKRASRYRHPLTIAYIDIDDFRLINNNYGHQAGDRTLRQVAEVLKNNIRETDFVTRLGGDKFLILLPGSGYEPAQGVVLRLQKCLQKTVERQKLGTTFSIGMITFLEPPEAVDEMLAKADHLMYSLKNNGKKCLKHITVT
ncbi:MAG: GGDEF domain-containing protein [Kastovskya adunca ATA6-11-RM4]|jgi:diguanylate cyclase (GGDEF)-like protein|nr:GGDEF domain-containing protein [Kastovskya adunca ATA6-11-RM4]